MLIAFIHLSDFHFRELGQPFHTYARDIARTSCSVFSHGQRVHPILVITGDLAYSGEEEQYHTVDMFFEEMLQAVEESFGTSPHLAMVPGNHDIKNPWETTQAVEDWLEQSRDDMELALQLELSKSAAYFSFARERGLAINENDGSCILTLTLKEGAEVVRIRTCMLASSPFSSLGNDCGKHHLLPETTSSIQQSICVGEQTSYNVLLMHHPEYWFNDETKLRLNAEISKDVDFLFTGHEHLESYAVNKTELNGSTFISRCGQLSRDSWQTSSFSCTSFDTRTHAARKHEFTWNPQLQMYVQSNDTEPTLVFPKGGLRPRSTYLQELMLDTVGISNTIMDYFEFPSLRVSGQSGNRLITKSSSPLNEEALFKELCGLQIVNIYGDRNSGKSTLLKYLYARSIDFGYAPLFLDPDTATRSFEKSFQGVIASQYGESDASRSRYQQLDYDRKMLLIDDFHALRKKTRDGDYLNAALGSVSTVIVATDSPLFQDDAIDGIPTLSSEETLCYLRIGSFTKSRRDKLVSRVCSARNVDRALWDRISNALNDSVARYRTLFRLTQDLLFNTLSTGLMRLIPLPFLLGAQSRLERCMRVILRMRLMELRSNLIAICLRIRLHGL